MLHIFNRRRKHIEKIGNAIYSLVWERKRLPDAGAGQYAFESYGTPTYDFALGNGATFVRFPLQETQPARWANFVSPIIANPPQNIFQGQFATQPLMNPTTADALAITGPGSVPPDAYNAIPPQAPVFSP